jgi:secreted trypsin-like serine protease
MSLVVRHDVPDEKFIALANEYPQIVHLADGEATLISEEWLLTAAHVAHRLSEELKNGGIPEVIIQKKTYAVEKVILHPNFEMSPHSIANDIALIKIQGEVIDIEPALLYNKQNEKGKPITIVGRGDFGTGLTGPQKMDKITRAATNTIDGTSQEWVYFKFDAPQSPNTTELEGVSGPGDSGGPAFFDSNGKRYLLGVSSHQRGNGKQGVYGVTEYYSRVSFFKEWIEKTIY